jgi:hypothetical protein
MQDARASAVGPAQCLTGAIPADGAVHLCLLGQCQRLLPHGTQWLPLQCSAPWCVSSQPLQALALTSQRRLQNQTNSGHMKEEAHMDLPTLATTGGPEEVLHKPVVRELAMVSGCHEPCCPGNIQQHV